LIFYVFYLIFFRNALNDLNRSSKPLKILSEEVKVIEEFPEKVK